MTPPMATLYRNNIIVPIAVVPPLLPGKDPQLVCPAFIVPPGDWSIVWNLVTIHYAELVHATFPETRGVELMVGQPQNFNSSMRISETQWAASVSNETKSELSKAFPLFYVVSFFYPGPTAAGATATPVLYTSQNRGVIRHDPTIVVSQDPVEPP